MLKAGSSTSGWHAWGQHTCRHICGWALIVAGVMGLVLPVIPGLPLLIAGAALLGPDHPLVRTWKARIARWRNKGSGAENRRNTASGLAVTKKEKLDSKAHAADRSGSRIGAPVAPIFCGARNTQLH